MPILMSVLMVGLLLHVLLCELLHVLLCAQLHVLYTGTRFDGCLHACTTRLLILGGQILAVSHVCCQLARKLEVLP